MVMVEFLMCQFKKISIPQSNMNAYSLDKRVESKWIRGNRSSHLRSFQVASVDPMQKKKKLRLDVSKGKGSKTGTMLYVRSIFTAPILSTESLAVAKELVDTGVAKAVTSSSLEKSVTLLKRTKAGSGCKDSTQICEKLAKIADPWNGFAYVGIARIFCCFCWDKHHIRLIAILWL